MRLTEGGNVTRKEVTNMENYIGWILIAGIITFRYVAKKLS